MPYQQRATNVTIPAPYGGWNARDALTAMPPTDAVAMENFIPDVTSVRLRDGYSIHANTAGTRVDTLMEWAGPASSKLLAATSGGKIMDVTTTATSTTSATATSTCATIFSNGQFQHTMMGTPAGNFLVFCNGTDKPFHYDGTTYATSSITGVTAGSTALNNVCVHQQRLWFSQASTLDMWFLPTQSIAGAATRIQLGPYCKKGGNLLAIASWTRDGGAGMDDQLVCITSKGEAILWSGTDPTSSTLFQMVGVFEIPIPVGKRCVTQIGADLALITSEGVVPLSNILALSPGGAAKVAATEKITNAFQAAYQNGSTIFGWQVIENSRERLLMVNVPSVANTTTYQYVMNTKTGAWCKFKGINTNCWANLVDVLYFGGQDGKVYQYAGLTTDVGAAITGKVTGAFTTLNAPITKQFLMARPYLIAQFGIIPGVGIHVDYDTNNITTVTETGTTSGTLWDTAQWDTFQWATDAALTNQWQTLNGVGVAVAPELQVTSVIEVDYFSMDLMYEQGGLV